MKKGIIVCSVLSIAFLCSRAQAVTKIDSLCATPESLVKNFFKTMSGSAGQDRDSILFVTFYYPQSFYWHIFSRPSEMDSLKVQTTFTTPAPGKDTVVISQFTRWKINGFNEKAVSIKIDRYENIAQAWVVAEVKPKEAESLTYRVQDSFQLFNDGKRWWIMSIAWQPETKWRRITTVSKLNSLL